MASGITQGGRRALQQCTISDPECRHSRCLPHLNIASRSVMICTDQVRVEWYLGLEMFGMQVWLSILCSVDGWIIEYYRREQRKGVRFSPLEAVIYEDT